MKLAISLLVSLGFLALSVDAQFGFLRNVFGGGNRGNRRPQGRPQQSGGGGFRNGGGSGGCRAPPANYQYKTFGNTRYLPTWELGCRSFSHGAGANYCRSIGMRPVSLEDPNKTNFYMNLVSRAGEKYFWTGGSVNSGSVSWANGVRQGVNQVGPWSHTGGAGRRQPDNREGNEFCLAVLNNFYQDGVKFHDVSCHHEKPTICEG